ncbi:MAG: sulfur oxidation c-type cytochrome SoxA, partial [Proteobacteria bacterium]|nr:sulfur oxidation c-type cytochrome SoxA [Pseudomonadota bacterium]
MKNALIATVLVLAGSLFVQVLSASPEDDVRLYQDYFKKRFPSIDFQEFANGVYAI